MSIQQAESISKQADVLRNQGQTERAQELYLQAADLFEAANEKIKAVDTRFLLVSTCLHMEGKREEAVKMGEEAARRFAELGAPDLEGAAYINIGIAYLNDGQLSEAQGWLKKALETLQNVELGSGPANFGISHTKLGHTYAKESRFEEAENELAKALEILCRIGHRFFEHTTRMHLAQMFFAKKDYTSALTHARASMDILREENVLEEHQRRVAELYGIIARSYWGLGNEEWGARYFQEAANLINKMPDDVARIVCQNIGAEEFLHEIGNKRPQDRAQLNLKALAR